MDISNSDDKLHKGEIINEQDKAIMPSVNTFKQKQDTLQLMSGVGCKKSKLKPAGMLLGTKALADIDNQKPTAFDKAIATHPRNDNQKHWRRKGESLQQQKVLNTRNTCHKLVIVQPSMDKCVINCIKKEYTALD